MSKIIITDTSLRDGSHTVGHKFTLKEIEDTARALDMAGIDIIEVGHGDGLAGSSINYGEGINSDIEIIQAAKKSIENAKLAVLLLPGIGTVEDLKDAHRAGADIVRVATHVTEANVSQQHIRAAKELDMFVVGFLMMAHRADVDRVVEEALKMESYGADVVYVTDSAGAMLPNDVTAKVRELRKNLDIPVGFHSHNNLGAAIGNSLAALDAGATYIDGSLGGLGAGGGNTATEMLVAAIKRSNYRCRADLFKTMDASRDVLGPILKNHSVDLQDMLDPMIIGYSGVYSSFMLHAKKAEERFGIDYRDIIIELGKKEAVGGQEDWILEIAKELAENKKA